MVEQIGAAECCFPPTLTACNLDDRPGLVQETVKGFGSRSPAIAVRARGSASTSALASTQHRGHGDRNFRARRIKALLALFGTGVVTTPRLPAPVDSEQEATR
jgi:hypothetical protein